MPITTLFFLLLPLITALPLTPVPQPAPAPHHQSFSAIPQSQWSFKPSTTLCAKYAQPQPSSLQQSEKGYHHTMMNLTTTIPSLNLDNGDAVTSVSCSPDAKSVIVGVKNETIVQDAQTWSPKMMLLISQRWNCTETTSNPFRLVSSIVPNPADKTITFTTTPCDVTKWMDSYVIDVDWVPAKETEAKAKRGIFDKIGDVVDKAGDTVGDAAGKVVDKAGDVGGKVVDKVGDAGGKVVDTAKDAAGAAKKKVGDAVDKAGDVGGKVVDKAKKTVGKAADKVGDTAKKTANKVSDTTKKAAGGVKATAKKVVDGAKDTGEKIVDAAGDAASKVGDGAGKVIDAAGDAAKKAGEVIKDAGDAAGDAAKKAGEKIGEVITGPDGILDINKDGSNKLSLSATLPPNFPLLPSNITSKISTNNTSTGLTCTKCFAKGSATLSLHIDSKKPQVLLTMKTDLELNIDLGLSGSIGIGPKLSLKPIDIPLSPLSVPGVLNIGPAFIVQVGAEATASVSGEIGFGGDVKLSDYSITTSLLDTKILNSTNSRPKLTAHPPKLTKSSASLTTSLTITPQLALEISLFNGIAFEQKAGIGITGQALAGLSLSSTDNCNGTSPKLQSKLGGGVDVFVGSLFNQRVVSFPELVLVDKCL